MIDGRQRLISFCIFLAFCPMRGLVYVYCMLLYNSTAWLRPNKYIVSYLMFSSLISFCHVFFVLFYLLFSYLFIVSYLILSYLICLVLSCIVLSCVISPYLVLSDLILSCLLVLSYPILSYCTSITPHRSMTSDMKSSYCRVRSEFQSPWLERSCIISYECVGVHFSVQSSDILMFCEIVSY